MAVTLEQVNSMIIEEYRMLPRRTAASGSASAEFNYYTHGDFVTSIDWMWHRCRTGIAVCIRGGELALFVPFCNPHYRNTWSDQARSRVPAIGLPPDMWWSNGWTLCGDAVSDQLWTDNGVCAILNMIMSACQDGIMSDCDFIINKRDSAVVRHDRCDALNPMDTYQDPMRMPNLVPVLSLYTGDQFADVAMPLPVDWQRLTRGTFKGQRPQACAARPKEVPWETKADCAVFRGSLTGTGGCPLTNQRMALLQRHDGVRLDLRGTGMNRRLRYCPLKKRVVIPQGIDNVGKHHMIQLHEQQSQYRYAVTADGHSGADRLASLMGGNQCILKIDPPAHSLCPDTWASLRMHAWEHYVPVRYDLSDIEHNLEWARRSPEATKRLRQNNQEWARVERRAILEWWVQASADMSSLMPFHSQS